MVLVDSAQVSEVAERTSECRLCPEWVVRCAHYGDKCITVHNHSGRWVLCVTTNPPLAGPKPNVHLSKHYHLYNKVNRDSLDFALAEEMLLAGVLPEYLNDPWL